MAYLAFSVAWPAGAKGRCPIRWLPSDASARSSIASLFQGWFPGPCHAIAPPACHPRGSAASEYECSNPAQCLAHTTNRRDDNPPIATAPRAAPQPFTAPAVSPEAYWSTKNEYTSATGTEPSSAPAISGPQK